MKKKSPTILRVAFSTPAHKLFDYLAPQEMGTLPFVPGLRVLAPFGSRDREKMGVVVEVASTSSVMTDKLKTILHRVDETPLLSPALWDLVRWASDYYHCGLGEVWFTAVPTALQKAKPPALLSSEVNQVEPYGGEVVKKAASYPLNEDQRQAIKAIIDALGAYKTFLLEGVTGSGKTEVYLRLIERVVKTGQQVLLLVPEIGLTPQMWERLAERFQAPMVLLHSSLTEKQKKVNWLKARTGEASIILGTRSAAWVTLSRLGLLILDEEHDLSFRQQEGFRYSARDLLIKRAQLENCPVVLGSATPSLETLRNVELGRYSRLLLKARIGQAMLPTIEVINTRDQRLEEGLSPRLLSKIKNHLVEKGQVLIFRNRRGYAPVIFCSECGFIPRCAYCDAKLTFHRKKWQLICHHCETKRPYSPHCPQCRVPRETLYPLGVGTERLEEALQGHFPDYPVIRLDRDNTKKKNSLKEAFGRLKEGEPLILLGTQMIAKGHHFPNITLVAIVDIDNALFSSDFRSTERMGQVITQVAGRAGRAERKGEVLLQTCQPDHPLLRLLLEKGYASFSEALLLERQTAHLPPYSYHALVRAQSKKAGKALSFLQGIKEQAADKAEKNFSGIKLLGPVAATMEKRAGQYRAQLLVQALSRGELKRAVRFLKDIAEEKASKYAERYYFEVDPSEMF